VDTETPALDALVGLVRLLEDQWEPLEADFQRFYGLDLRRACWGPDALGARRLRVLISHLPQDSSLARSMGWWWSDVHEMQAQLIELAALSAQATTATVGSLTGKRWRPTPANFPRPTLPSVPVPAGPPAPRAPAPGLSRETIRATLLRRSV
jgi:hypothetical protein